MELTNVPSCRNFLREPLTLGVPLPGLLTILFLVCTVVILGGTNGVSNAVAGGIAVIGYLTLLMYTRFSLPGSFYRVASKLDKLRKKSSSPVFELIDSRFRVHHIDTLDIRAIYAIERENIETLLSLEEKKALSLVFKINERGTSSHEIKYIDFEEGSHFEGSLEGVTQGIATDSDHCYSLHQFPVHTNPLTAYGWTSAIRSRATILLRIELMDLDQVKAMLERSRRRQAPNSEVIENIDAKVSFEESSQVLERISRGEERIFNVSYTIVSPDELNLPKDQFVKLSGPRLAVLSALGLRKQAILPVASPCISITHTLPVLGDPKETGRPVFFSRRGARVYFNPLDQRLEALHWIVSGASGAGKSFLVGALLRRLIKDGEEISVLYLDHNRSFQRSVRAIQGKYLTPGSMFELNLGLRDLVYSLNDIANVSGIELSDLDHDEQREAISKILGAIEEFLRERSSLHTIFIVIDECWAVLKEDPKRVQRAFREYRKLNAGVIAITQSIQDFLNDPEGRSIFQNAPTRILLRQGEDVSDFQRLLSLNATELDLVNSLRQENGRFSELLIKTPFLSRLARFKPTKEEFELFRTDNLREERVREAQCKNS